MTIRQMHHPEEITEALDLIWETFLQFDAPDYAMRASAHSAISSAMKEPSPHWSSGALIEMMS